MKKYFLIILFALFGLNDGVAQCSCCGSASGFSGTESTPGVFMLGKKQWMAESYVDLRSYSGVSTNTSSHDQGKIDPSQSAIKNMAIGILGLRYGITNKATLIIQQPYFWINNNSASSKTFGDLLSLVNYALIKRDKMNIALQAGMEWPTGQYVQMSNGNAVSTGSGSYDPVAGINFMKTSSRSLLRANAFVKYTTKGFNEIYYGNFFGHQLGYTYFIINRKNGCGTDSLKKGSDLSLSLNAMISGEWMQGQLKDHAFIANTGGYTALGSFGTTLSFKGISIPVLISAPFYSCLHGSQNQNTIRIRIGITKTFN